MRVGDMKRAVEDVILRPEENHTGELQKRTTIAALDLCQLSASPSPTPPIQPSAATINACSCSSEVVAEQTEARPPPPLCTSTSLDTIVNRPQPIIYRHSAGVSRRQSRVLGNLHSKRKRSNSLTNYHKSQGISVSLPPSSRQTPLRFNGEEEVFRNSLGSSESHSSVARSEAEDCFQDFVPEEDESAIVQAHMSMVVDMGMTPNFTPSIPLTPSHSLASSSSSNPFSNYRQRTDEDEDMECD